MSSNIPKDKNIHKISLTINKEDIDDLGHVNNIVYLKWIQSAAQSHWENLTSSGLRSKYFWVVLRHELDYIKPAFLNDEITAVTWVEWHKGAQSKREVKILRNNQILASATTLWCLLDAKTMKPKRIDEDIIRLFS